MHTGAGDEEARRRATLEDELLAIRCQLGEPTAFDALIERWHTPLWAYVRRLTSDDDAAAEAVQETWMRILRGFGRLRDPACVRAWIFGIARRTVMDRLRARYAEPARVDIDPAEIAGAEDPDDLREAVHIMHEELARMPIVERDVLVLFYLKELTLGELAEVIGVPVGTVKSRLYRARHMLRRQLLAKGVQS